MYLFSSYCYKHDSVFWLYIKFWCYSSTQFRDIRLNFIIIIRTYYHMHFFMMIKNKCYFGGGDVSVSNS